MKEYQSARTKEETRLYLILRAPGNKSEPVTGSAWLHDIFRVLSDAGTDRDLASGFMLSPTLKAIMDEGIASGMMLQEGGDGPLRLSRDGLRVARDLWTRTPQSERLRVSSAKEFFNDMTYGELCAHARADSDADPDAGARFDQERVDAAVSMFRRLKVSVSRAVTISGLSEGDFFKELKDAFPPMPLTSQSSTRRLRALRALLDTSFVRHLASANALAPRRPFRPTHHHFHSGLELGQPAAKQAR